MAEQDTPEADPARWNQLISLLSMDVVFPFFDQMGLALQRLAKERCVALTETLAIGDGSNDIPMLQQAGLGIAFCGKPKVKQAIPVWLDHAGPTGLLYLQGYKRSEFAAEH